MNISDWMMGFIMGVMLFPSIIVFGFGLGFLTAICKDLVTMWRNGLKPGWSKWHWVYIFPVAFFKLLFEHIKAEYHGYTSEIVLNKKD